MKSETIVLLVVAGAAVAGGVWWYKHQKNNPPPAVADRNNANQRNPVKDTDHTAEYVAAGVGALEAIGNAFGGW